MNTPESVTIDNSFLYRVRYADTDKMQYMYNGEYLRLFEIGRTELLRAGGLPYKDLETDGFLLPVLEARIHYKSAAFYDDVLEIQTNYTLNYKPTIDLNYRILRGVELIAEGYTVHAFVSGSSRKPVRPPTRFFEMVAAYHKTLTSSE